MPSRRGRLPPLRQRRWQQSLEQLGQPGVVHLVDPLMQLQ